MKHLPDICIQVIPHKAQRYDTCGDYWEDDNGNWQVRISKTKWKDESCTLLHELVEMILTIHHKVSWAEIDRFDMSNQELQDPGSCKKAPYHKEHMAAIKVEGLMSLSMGIYGQKKNHMKWEVTDEE